MQYEITKSQNLLRKNGALSECGYARSPILRYDRNAITASKYKIKEWDSYLICNPNYAIALTIADYSYIGVDSISLLDFKRPWHHTKAPVRVLPRGETNLPSSSESGHAESFCKNHFLSFRREKNYRLLKFHMGDFYDHKSLDGEIALEDPKGDSAVIALPFEDDPHNFYYSQKINCLPAQGYMTFGDNVYTFEPSDSLCTLDWSRGVWPRESTRYWGSASGFVKSQPFGFNIGAGVGDTSSATENMLFFNHKAHKLSQIHFNIPEKNGEAVYLDPWFFTSDDDRFKMVFQPVMDCSSQKDVKLLSTDRHQVFGLYTGRAVLDDGTPIHIRDFLGFAEKFRNKW